MTRSFTEAQGGQRDRELFGLPSGWPLELLRDWMRFGVTSLMSPGSSESRWAVLSNSRGRKKRAKRAIRICNSATCLSFVKHIQGEDCRVITVGVKATKSNYLLVYSDCVRTHWGLLTELDIKQQPAEQPEWGAMRMFIDLCTNTEKREVNSVKSQGLLPVTIETV